MKARIQNSMCGLGLFLLLWMSPAFSVEFSGVEVAKPLSQEEFEKRVMASFGFLSSREPELNRAEYAILEKFVPFLEEDPEFALTMIEGLTKNNKDLTASFDFMLGNLYVQANRLEDAESAYKASIEKYPDYLRAWRSLGLLYMNSDDIENSLESLTRAIQLGDTDPLTFGQIGYCFYVKKEYLSSLSAYTQAVLYEPRNTEWMRGKVATLTALRDYQQANVILQDIVRREPETADYWMELANNWVRLDEPEKAAACLEFLRGAGLETRYSMEMLGTIYSNQTLYDMALGVYEEMIDSDFRPRASSLLRCARMLQRGGFEGDAEALVERYLASVPDLNPSDEVALLRYRGGLREAAEDYEEAKVIVEKALELKPDDAESMVALGRIEYQLGNASRALVLLGQAELHSSVANEAAVMQAQILVEQRDYARAEKKLENALINGGDIWVERYYEEVKMQGRKAALDRLTRTQLLSE